MKVLFESRRAETPTLSVIIPYKNASPTILVALESLAIQEAEFAFEVIFADGCSDDDSVELIKKHRLVQKPGVSVSVVTFPPEKSGQMPATNASVKIARAELLLLMQADVKVTDPRALAKLVKCFENPKVIGTLFTMLGAGEDFAKYNFWGQVFNARYEGHRVENHFDTKFNALRKLVFEKIGGYDEVNQALAGGDTDLYQRLKPEGEFAPTDIEGWHLHGLGQEFTFGGCIKKYCRNAEAAGVAVHFNLKQPSVGLLIGIGLQFFLCVMCLLTLVPWTWPWTPLVVFLLGVYWQKDSYVHCRGWRKIYLPFFGVIGLYVFTWYFLSGLILKKTRFQFSNRMGRAAAGGGSELTRPGLKN
ncbi:MAG: glycosyltransferase [Verrucomicrobia bacterium]|nr:glycosyltransferase [Verrucomicrobiota bacterium]